MRLGRLRGEVINPNPKPMFEERSEGSGRGVKWGFILCLTKLVICLGYWFCEYGLISRPWFSEFLVCHAIAILRRRLCCGSCFFFERLINYIASRTSPLSEKPNSGFLC